MNSVNGVPCCANKRFLKDIARGEWGFEGFHISDWDAIGYIYSKHHYAKSLLDAVALAANAGMLSTRAMERNVQGLKPSLNLLL